MHNGLLDPIDAGWIGSCERRIANQVFKYILDLVGQSGHVKQRIRNFVLNESFSVGLQCVWLLCQAHGQILIRSERIGDVVAQPQGAQNTPGKS